MANQESDLQKQESVPVEGAERTRARKVYTPLVDIYENGDSIFVIADMPGVDEQGIDISMEKNLLTLKGTVSTMDPVGCSLTYAEYGQGDYERVFTISNEVDRDAVEATIKDGVLRLTLPKSKDNFLMSPGEEEGIAAAKSTVSDTRMWSGPFVVPSKFATSSQFGMKRVVNTRRSSWWI